MMNKDSKIFVAGHKGLVGSALLRRLNYYGYDNIITKTKEELDLRDKNQIKNFFNVEKPEYVFLAAAKVGGIMYNKNYPADFIYDNIQIQTNVIHESFLVNVKKLLFLGSACIYPKITEQPIREEYLMTSELEPTNEAYSLSKILGLKMCNYYYKQYGFNCISAMPANLYGINDNFNLEKCHVIPAFIRKILDSKENNSKDIICFGDGSPIREFLFSDDLADACIFLMNNYNSPEIINVGSNLEISIKDLVELISKKLNYTGEIIWDKTKSNGAPLRKLCTKKIKSLGWNPSTNLEDGLQITIDWYLKNKNFYERN
jgi:GDP-L-fucose synthase